MNICKEIGKFILITSMASLGEIGIKTAYDKIKINNYYEQRQSLEKQLIENNIERSCLSGLGELNKIIEEKKDDLLYELIIGASMLCTSAIGAGLLLVKKDEFNKIYKKDQELGKLCKSKILVIGKRTDLDILDKVMLGRWSTTDLKKRTNDKMEIKSLENALAAVREIEPVECHYCDHDSDQVWKKYFDREDGKLPYSMIISTGRVKGYSGICGLPGAIDVSEKVQNLANKWNIPLYPVDAPGHYFRELFGYWINGKPGEKNIFIPPVEI